MKIHVEEDALTFMQISFLTTTDLSAREKHGLENLSNAEYVGLYGLFIVRSFWASVCCSIGDDTYMSNQPSVQTCTKSYDIWNDYHLVYTDCN